MKNLKRMACLIIMIFMMSAFVLTGCGGLKDNPPTAAAVYSNGGMSVIKGDYLYYVNGYVNEDDLSDASSENVAGKVVKGAIYRTKLVNGTVQKDKDGFIKNDSGKSLTECVVSKIVGFSNGGFHIIDDRIYYATPCMTYSSTTDDNDSALQNELVEFHSVNIDGTDDKTIYTTTDDADVLEWNVTKIGKKVYITSYTGKTLMVADATDKKLLNTVKDVTSCAIPDSTEYIKDTYKDTATINNYIYYTRAVKDTDNQASNYAGNVVCRLKVSSGNGEVVKYDNTTTYTMKYAKNDCVYYTKNNKAMGDLSLLYKNKLDGATFTNSTETKVTNMALTDFIVLDYEYNYDANGHKVSPVSTSVNTVIGQNKDGKIYRFESIDGTDVSSSDVKLINTASSSTKMLTVDGATLYVAESNVVYKINTRADLTNGEAEKVLVSKDNYTYLVTNKNFFDFTNDFLFTYAEFKVGETTNYYLTYIDIANDYTSRFVGEFAEGDMPEQPEQKEGYDAKDPNCQVEYTPWID